MDENLGVKERDYPGTFIVVEGADGAGTTTQSKKLAEKLEAEWTFEPTDKRIGVKVDEMISSEDHSPETVALGFAADRMAHLEDRVIPWLKEGKTVVSDRYYHSSLVYQPVMGADREWIDGLNKETLKPDLTFILDISAEIGMERVDERGRDGNIFEDLSFQEKVVKRYRRLENESTILVDASNSEEEVFKEINSRVEQNIDL
ncbi:MAG: dTMP kinase [Nanohaloarchaea archaeon SW_7_43_1]|nr:MAG: dTMP kinase [Nanohaloarchaea archaeon SW_7_43_1]